MRPALTAALSIVLAACATPYQPKGIGGAYDDAMLGPDVAMVSFAGNYDTSTQRALDYLMLRAAELTIEHGFQYFTLTNSAESHDKDASFAAGSAAFWGVDTQHTTEVRAFVRMFHESAGGTFEASTVAASIPAKLEREAKRRAENPPHAATP